VQPGLSRVAVSRGVDDVRGEVSPREGKKDMRSVIRTAVSLLVLTTGASLWAQVSPSREEIDGYSGLFAAAADGIARKVEKLVASGADPDGRDGHGRTPLMVAAYLGHHGVMRALASSGADPNAKDEQSYDVVTIAAVADDLSTLEVALSIGGDPTNITSPYDGTALIAAAHLGHAEIVRTLAGAGAPLDHVNNLGWTALIEAIVLGNGGASHTYTVEILLDAGANPHLPNRNGVTPISLAQARGFDAIVTLLEKAGAYGG
jgi:ankyrin repeat protein